MDNIFKYMCVVSILANCNSRRINYATCYEIQISSTCLFHNNIYIKNKSYLIIVCLTFSFPSRVGQKLETFIIAPHIYFKTINHILCNTILQTNLQSIMAQSTLLPLEMSLLKSNTCVSMHLLLCTCEIARVI